MRRALGLVLVLAACAAPVGQPVEECDASWRDVESVIVTPVSSEGDAVALDCIRQVDEYRIRIGFQVPAGPSCYVLSAYRVAEGADAVSVTLHVSATDDPAAGACADEARRVATEIDLQAPVDGRILLDGSAAP